MSPAELRRITLVRTLVASGKAREQRRSRHLTLKEVADAIGASRSTVHRWEAGETFPSAVHALAWAAVLGISDTETELVA
ncbi:helix-turn-helix transcriptional regulator [Streptomyces lincolnensis]|uniref:helix-turn-helix transcriptional regulator n=1 Tax=Streptomyces lincolnensis TaxID=1915 RepID=UPI0037D6F294